MRKLITTLLITAAMIAPAAATQAKWGTVPYWQVVGDAAGPYCGAWTEFSNGQYFHISLNPEGWHIAIQGVAAVPGQTYTFGVATKDKSGVLTGVGSATGNAIMFRSLDWPSIRSIALTPRIAIADIGVFPMRGSAKAIVAIYNCYQSVSGKAL